MKSPSSKLSWFESLLSPNEQKRNAELFFWKWHIFWLAWFGGIVILKTYETFTAWSYMKVGFIVGLPPIILPLIYPKISGEENILWYQRSTTKINAFVAIIAWVGNYFWTHYFYTVLGTTYTFPAHCINQVPFALFLITHSYFLLYHNLGGICLRLFWLKYNKLTLKYTFLNNKNYKCLSTIICVIIMGYITALLEVASIASFPYYDYPDTYRMWLIGSGFYAIYFFISYPLYTYIDESNKPWTLQDVVIYTLAYAMFTTMLLDGWKQFFGQLNDLPPDQLYAVCVPWSE